jgi:hypothetical protein
MSCSLVNPKPPLHPAAKTSCQVTLPSRSRNVHHLHNEQQSRDNPSQDLFFATMDVDQFKPEPITPAVEGASRNRTRSPQSELTLSLLDAVVSFHITHSDSIPRTLARRLQVLASIPSLPLALQEHPNKVSSSSKHRELREIETNRYSVSVKRFARARQVAKEQEGLYEKQLEVVEAEIKREELALKKEREMLAEQERIKESHGKVAAKLKELSSRPKQRVELDRYVFTIRSISWRFVC